uniref:Uncharacterized protein n=1 Tax=Arundo donax TaxID=35708 RepID=A0A0A9HF85_ARUDO
MSLFKRHKIYLSILSWVCLKEIPYRTTLGSLSFSFQLSSLNMFLFFGPRKSEHALYP